LTELESRAPGTLARWAAVLDPEAARRIHARDAVRLVRAIEVALASGRRLSEWQRAHAFADAPYDVLLLGLALPQDALAARIEARVDDMLASGWLDEVRALAARVPPEAPAWRTLGYRELREAVAGRVTLDQARAAAVQATRRFAKRQRTWFRREAGVVWRDAGAERARILADAEAFLVAKPPDAG